MDPITQQQALATAGAAGGERLYAEDLFAATTYTGTGTQQTITTGIDIANEGGFIWIKSRNTARNPHWYDDELGKTGTYYDFLNTRSIDTPNTGGLGGITTFNSDGFTLSGTNTSNNAAGETYVAWSFRKAPGFMTSVKYTGNGTSGRTVSHDLDSVPGMIIVKRLDDTGDWMVYHHGMGANYAQELNDDAQRITSAGYWNNTDPTSTEFTLGNNSKVNVSGGEYIAYLFADDDQRFGANSDESVISCASWTSDGDVNVGWEPQWCMFRHKGSHSDVQHWHIIDSLRGFLYGTYSPTLLADSTAAENEASGAIRAWPTATGFYAYHPFYAKPWMSLLVRRAHKPASTATDVFAAQATRAATDGTMSTLSFTSGFRIDMLWQLVRTGGAYNATVLDRIRGNKVYLYTNGSGSENSTGGWQLDSDEGIWFNTTNAATSQYGGLMFKRAPGFLDIVGYTGTGSARTINHSLGVVPKMMIVKHRSATESWSVYTEAYGNAKTLWLNDNSGGITSTQRWNSTTPTDSVFSVGTDTGTNASGVDYIAYLFGDVSGISKVGSYTGTGNNIDIDCGFTNGARFVLIKRYGGSGEWYVWDSARGIVAGNEPYIELNTQAAENANFDYIDPLNSGFTVTSTANIDLNENGGTYVFLAIA